MAVSAAYEAYRRTIAKNIIESKRGSMAVMYGTNGEEGESDPFYWQETPEERFGREWEALLELYGVLRSAMANDSSVSREVAEHARASLAARMDLHGLGSVVDLLAIDDPKVIVDRLAPRAILRKALLPKGAHFGPAVLAETEEQLEQMVADYTKNNNGFLVTFKPGRDEYGRLTMSARVPTLDER